MARARNRKSKSEQEAIFGPLRVALACWERDFVEGDALTYRFERAADWLMRPVGQASRRIVLDLPHEGRA